MKYYYGIELKNGRSYTVSSEAKDITEFIKKTVVIDSGWCDFECASSWSISGEEDVVNFDRALIKEEEIISISYCKLS